MSVATFEPGRAFSYAATAASATAFDASSCGPRIAPDDGHDHARACVSARRRAGGAVACPPAEVQRGPRTAAGRAARAARRTRRRRRRAHLVPQPAVVLVLVIRAMARRVPGEMPVDKIGQRDRAGIKLDQHGLVVVFDRPIRWPRVVPSRVAHQRLDHARQPGVIDVGPPKSTRGENDCERPAEQRRSSAC